MYLSQSAVKVTVMIGKGGRKGRRGSFNMIVITETAHFYQ